MKPISYKKDGKDVILKEMLPYDHFITNISDKTGVKKEVVKKVYEASIMEIKRNLEKGNYVTVRGFGCFMLRDRKAKLGFDMIRNTPFQIPARKVIFFKPLKKVAKNVAENVK